GAASALGIYRRSDDADFLDQVRTGERARQRTIVVAPVGDVETVSRHIDRVKPSARKKTVKVSFRWPCAGYPSEQIDHVAAAQGKVAYSVFRDDGSHRG